MTDTVTPAQFKMYKTLNLSTLILKLSMYTISMSLNMKALAHSIPRFCDDEFLKYYGPIDEYAGDRCDE